MLKNFLNFYNQIFIISNIYIIGKIFMKFHNKNLIKLLDNMT